MNVGQPILKNTVCVLPEAKMNESGNLEDCYGICTDFPKRYEKIYEENFTNKDKAEDSTGSEEVKTESGEVQHVEG